jgi:hypothetical protein
MASPRRRYEFRIFGVDVERFAVRLRAHAAEISATTSEELYLLSRADRDANVKLRADRLDVKSLVAREGRFELWEATAQLDLPIGGAVFKRRAGEALALDFDLPDGAVLDRDALVALCDAHRGLDGVALRKRRLRFTIPPGWGEIVDLEIGAHALRSVAVEAADRDAAGELVALAGMEGEANTSYPRFLHGLQARV